MYSIEWSSLVDARDPDIQVSRDKVALRTKRKRGHIGLIAQHGLVDGKGKLGQSCSVRVLAVQVNLGMGKMRIGFADPLYFVADADRSLSSLWWGVTSEGYVVRAGITDPHFRSLVPGDKLVLVLDATRQIAHVFLNKARVATMGGVLAQVPILFLDTASESFIKLL